MKKFNEYLENRQLQDPQAIEVYKKFLEIYDNIDEHNFAVKKLINDMDRLYAIKDSQRSEDAGAYELTLQELDKLQMSLEAALKQCSVVSQMFNTHFQLPKSV